MIDNFINANSIFRISKEGHKFHAIRKEKRGSVPKGKSRFTIYNETIPELYNEFRRLFMEYVESLGNKTCKSRGKAARQKYISDGLVERFGYDYDMDEYAELAIQRTLNNARHRLKLFRRKADLNNWNYFVTFTYDSKKHTEESFRKDLLKCFGHLHTRNHWYIMGKFERAPETGRLHFHCLAYIPAEGMPGVLYKDLGYSRKHGRMKELMRNSYFTERFGLSEFEGIDDVLQCVNYISKYIIKDIDEKMFYSRGIPTFIETELEPSQDLSIDYYHFVLKHILNDETFVRKGRNSYFYLGKDWRIWYNKLKLVV